MYNTLLLIIFTTLCNWSQKWNHVPPVWDFVILDHHFAIFPLPASVATILISAIMSLVVLDVTYKWGQVFVFLCQAYIMFSNYTYGVTNDRIPFSRQIIFQCVCVCVCVSMHACMSVCMCISMCICVCHVSLNDGDTFWKLSLPNFIIVKIS
jgi:hypothetical protein